MQSHFEAYFEGLRQTPLREQTEFTNRGTLETLLRICAGTDTHVQHEPKRGDKGAPDFKIQRKGSILGYVEVKKIGVSLDEVLKSEQIAKYRTLSDNLILTDYLEWIWLDAKGVRAREILAFPTDLDGKKPKLKPERIEAVKKMLGGFFSEAPQGIARSEDLAYALATRSRLLRDYLAEELIRQDREHREARLFGLFEVFKSQVFHELTTKDFSDAFAQMLAYGLFLAKLSAENKLVTLSNARKFIPGSFRLIRELVEFIEQMDEPEYAEARWVVDEILSIVNGLDLASILEDLSFRARKAVSRKVRAGSEDEHRLFERDPFIYFYEDYLKHYDPAMRKSRGVYYTPPPVVNFIVRAVDDLLKDTFQIADGLADSKRVTVLDFACGTGTFILEVFEKIFENIGGPESGRADHIVREHMLRNVHGFEYLIAPYTIAHLKLSHYLREKGHGISDNSRLQIFLTNTLEPIAPQKNFLTPALAAEVEAAQHVKDKPILVILGNPPYSGHSKNKGDWITGLIDAYRKDFPDLKKPGQGKWLQDDYVKFIRFAQWKIDQVEEGLVGLITNHSFLDNPTFKGMRKSLSETFDQIYVFDLHGNYKKKEVADDGSKDENVFDIEQGVAISIFVKKSKLSKKILRTDARGSRQSKYNACIEETVSTINWTPISLNLTDYVFEPRDSHAFAEYEKLLSIREIFAPIGDPAPGIVTTHDEFAISFSRDEMISKVEELLKTKDEDDARSMFRLCSQEQWNYARAKEQLANSAWKKQITSVYYRPFDTRWTVFNGNVAVHRRERVMKHFIGKDNLGIVVPRQVKSGNKWHHVLASKLISESTTISNRTSEIGYLFPLLISDSENKFSENLSPDFRAFIDARYDHHYPPEDIFGYIYAVLHAPTYRTRYADFLRIDFPRIPFPETRADFEKLAALGWDLVQVHLMHKSLKTGLGKYQGKGKHEVEKVAWAEANEAVHINNTQFFAPVPCAVWEFHIGGYQVIDKYLKSRKGRVLSLDEIDQVTRITEALAFTLRQMDLIDATYACVFPS